MVSRSVKLTGRIRRWVKVVTRPEFLGLPPALLAALFFLGPSGLFLLPIACLPLLIHARQTAHPAPAPLAAVAGTHLARGAAISVLQSAIDQACGQGQSTACLLISLDDRQHLIDRHGQAALDQVLQTLSGRIAGSLRPHDILMRLTGDRFAVALGPLPLADMESLLQIALRIHAPLQQPVAIGSEHAQLSCSIGFRGILSAGGPQQGACSGGELLLGAEQALEEALRTGPAAIRAHSTELALVAGFRQNLRDQIDHALGSGQILAYFQPQVSTDTGAVTGFEALARWQHPERGLLSPAEFLPIISSSGLASRLGEVMLGQALNALKSWDRAGYAVPTVAINFSGEELEAPRLAERMMWELDRYDLAARRITVEVLETVAADDGNDMIARNIARLAELGCGVDLDDFGTGHASITSIHRFAVKRVKIDRSFITRVDSDPRQQQMVAAILSMCERLNLETLAEGVETGPEFAMLAQLGCGHVQGYAVARPMPFDETFAWLEQNRRKLQTPPLLGRKIS